jgi:hypothetical protein
MRPYPTAGEPFAVPLHRSDETAFAEHPAIAVIQTIAGELMELLGPMLWAAIIVLFFYAELLTS